MAKVSVIIPVYNGDRYLAEAIDSVLNQSYGDREIIIVDDGSTDNTRRVIRSYGKQIYCTSQQNQGVASSRNLGLEVATGEYIAFLDQDDLFLPHKLAAQVAILDRQPEVGIVNSGWNIIDATGQVVAAVQPWRRSPQLNQADLIVWKPVFLGAMLFRRSWLERIGGFNTQLQQTPDVDLVLRLVALGCTVDWVRQTTVNYRQHESNASNDTLKQAQELEQMLQQFFNQPDLAPEIKILESDSCYQSLIWSAWRLYHTGYLAEAINYLEKSFTYSSKYPTEIVLSWIESFKSYAAEYGCQIDVYALCNSPEWKKMMKQYVL